MDDFEKQLADQLAKQVTPPKKRIVTKAGKRIAQGGKNTPDDPNRLSPAQREIVRTQLVEHFGSSMVDKSLLGTEKIKDVNEVLCTLRDRMEKELDKIERDSAEYYEQIEKEYKTVGRPKSVFVWRELEYLCYIGCTLEEVAGFFQMGKSTVDARIKEEYQMTWAAYFERHSQGGKIALRRKQFSVAMEGSEGMLKFLGKNKLGQKDKLDIEGQVEVNSFADLVKNLEDKKNKTKESTNGNQKVIEPEFTKIPETTDESSSSK